MTESAHQVLAGWQVFYEVVGSSAGALVGLQFVVIALIANVRQRADVAAINAFGTPTVVHFSGALVISAVMTAPWPSVRGAAAALAALGACGIGSALGVFWHGRRQKEYKPMWTDWIWYGILPCAVYVALTATALLLPVIGATTQLGPFVVGGVALGLLLIGVHNAWDTVTHVVVEGPRKDEPPPA